MAKTSLRRRSSKRPIVDVNLLPFIDIILVLLVIFMITAPLAIQGIKLDLPQANSELLETTGKEIVVSFTHKKEFYLEDTKSSSAANRQPLELEQLVKQVEALSANKSNISLKFRADENLPYGEVIKAIDALNHAGITSLSLITELYDSKTE